MLNNMNTANSSDDKSKTCNDANSVVHRHETLLFKRNKNGNGTKWGNMAKTVNMDQAIPGFHTATILGTDHC